MFQPTVRSSTVRRGSLALREAASRSPGRRARRSGLRKPGQGGRPSFCGLYLSGRRQQVPGLARCDRLLPVRAGNMRKTFSMKTRAAFTVFRSTSR
jgi:hypothetical protein